MKLSLLYIAVSYIKVSYLVKTRIQLHDETKMIKLFPAVKNCNLNVYEPRKRGCIIVIFCMMSSMVKIKMSVSWAVTCSSAPNYFGAVPHIITLKTKNRPQQKISAPHFPPLTIMLSQKLCDKFSHNCFVIKKVISNSNYNVVLYWVFVFPKLPYKASNKTEFISI